MSNEGGTEVNRGEAVGIGPPAEEPCPSCPIRPSRPPRVVPNPLRSVTIVAGCSHGVPVWGVSINVLAVHVSSPSWLRHFRRCRRLCSRDMLDALPPTWAFADARVRERLGDRRYAVIGVARSDEKRAREVWLVLVVYCYDDGQAPDEDIATATAGHAIKLALAIAEHRELSSCCVRCQGASGSVRVSSMSWHQVVAALTARG